MDERGIIIADRDVGYRNQVAVFFRKAGYQVETTDTAVHAMQSILKKQTPVLLLGSDFDEKVSSADLIHLLKKCNRHLQVIMISDEMPLALARKVRQEGIFYHALKTATAGDSEELGQAVACAFEKYRACAQADAPQDSQEPPVVFQPDSKTGSGWHWIRKALPWIAGMSALIVGMSCIALAAAKMALDGGSLAVWIFLGFSALIVAGQLLPIFRIKLVLGWEEKRQATQQSNLRNGK